MPCSAPRALAHCECAHRRHAVGSQGATAEAEARSDSGHWLAEGHHARVPTFPGGTSPYPEPWCSTVPPFTYHSRCGPDLRSLLSHLKNVGLSPRVTASLLTLTFELLGDPTQKRFQRLAQVRRLHGDVPRPCPGLSSSASLRLLRKAGGVRVVRAD